MAKKKAKPKPKPIKQLKPVKPKPPKISALMPTYNRAKLIQPAIRSILDQTHKNLELIIYDDGSTDSTPRVIDNIRDKRIRYIRSRDNKGCAYARNQLMAMCDTSIACWMDSDDISHALRLAKQYEAMRVGKHHMTACRFSQFTTMKAGAWKGKPRKGGGKFAHASVMFKMKDVLSVGLKKSVGGSDATWLRNMKTKFGICHNVQEILYFVRRHNNRVGVWKKSPGKNPEWHARMMKYRNDK